MKSRDERVKGAAEAREARPAAPMPLLVAAWLVPGLGHLILGRKRRAAVFAAVILAAFVTGGVLQGKLAVPQPGAPFSWLAFLACLGNGILYVGGRLVGFANGTAMAPGYGYGNTFLITAGLMNLLLILDVADIARGLKD